jgi:hypothetical protein
MVGFREGSGGQIRNFSLSISSLHHDSICSWGIKKYAHLWPKFREVVWPHWHDRSHHHHDKGITLIRLRMCVIIGICKTTIQVQWLYFSRNNIISYYERLNIVKYFSGQCFCNFQVGINSTKLKLVCTIFKNSGPVSKRDITQIQHKDELEKAV